MLKLYFINLGILFSNYESPMNYFLRNFANIRIESMDEKEKKETFYKKKY